MDVSAGEDAPAAILMSTLIVVLGETMKIISDSGVCPACDSERLERVRRLGREDWVFDRVYVCTNCLERFGRVPPGNTTLIARILNLFKLI